VPFDPMSKNYRTFLSSGRLSGLGLFLLAALTPSRAFADEPIQPTEPRVLRDTSVDLLNIADAFDDEDDFDLNLRLGFEHEQRSADIHRETSIAQPGLSSGGYTSDALRVGTYHESTERLLPEINIGVLPDLALKVRMPVILANNRSINNQGPAGSSSLATAGLLGEKLFEVPFTSPTRSGIEYLAVGGDLALMNQFRNPSQPTWVIGVEGRFNVSEAMHACNKNPESGEESCAYPADINRNGTNDPLGAAYGNIAGDPEGDFTGGRGPGVSRGTTAFEGHAYVSKRLKYIEPYSGVSALVEFPMASSDYGNITIEGAPVNHPPLRGTVTAGLVVVPWEVPEKYQRISIDFRVRGTYVSEGRDYSELFDALGSSNASSLRQRNFSSYTVNQVGGVIDPNTPSVVDTASNPVYFTGITDVQQHGDYNFSGQFTWMAGKYVQFDLGANLRVVQAHYITFDQACNPDVLKAAADVTGAVDNATANAAGVALGGPCNRQTGTTTTTINGQPAEIPEWTATGVPNPEYRKVINEPGHRYKVDTSFGFSAWLKASVMF
jgi:hypothetical protein